MQEHEYLFFVEGIVFYTEGLAQAQAMLKAGNGCFCPRYFHLVAACYNPHIGVLVLETKDILIVYAVENRRIEVVLQGNDRVHK